MGEGYRWGDIMGRKVLGWGDIIGSGVLVERHNGKRGAGGETMGRECWCWWGDIMGREVLVERHTWEGGVAGET